MPFTLCHPALVIPLNRGAPRLTSLAALVIGSMAPDFVYFLPLGPDGGFTHSAHGIFLYCLPAGALVYFVYHALLRDALIAWAPRAIGCRMQPDVRWWPLDARAGAVLLASLAIGAACHIAWDAFTHANTVVVQQLDLLRSVVPIGAQGVPLFTVLQHLSSLAGFIVIAAYATQWYRRTPPGLALRAQASTRHKRYALALVAASALAGGAAGMLLRPARSVERVLFNITVSGMAAAALAILLLCIGWKIARTGRRTA